MNKDFFGLLYARLQQYDGGSPVFAEGNKYIIETLKSLYEPSVLPPHKPLNIKRALFKQNTNPFLPFYFAMQTHKQIVAFYKLGTDFNEINKHPNHPLYFLTMGFAHLYGVGKEKDLKLAYDYFKKGGKKDCLLCSFYLARFLLMGEKTIEVKPDIKKAVDLLEKASEAGLAAATHELAFLIALQESQKQFKAKTVRYLDLLIAQTNESQNTIYGNFALRMYKHFSVQDKTKNRPERDYWIRFAYEFKAPNSALIYYFFLQEVKETDQTAYAQSIEYLIEAAFLNHPVAKFELGNEYLKGNYLPKSLEMALKHYEKAAELGYKRAYLFLAELYITTKEIYNKEKAEHYINREYQRLMNVLALDKNKNFPVKLSGRRIHSRGKLRGYLYFELANLIVEHNMLEEALYYYEKALEYEFTDGTHVAIGDLYYFAVKDFKDEATIKNAHENYLAAYKIYLHESFERLGRCRALGFAVERDEERSEKFIAAYIHATKKNEIETLINYYTAISYEFNEGRVVPRNRELAHYYLEKALSLQKN